MKEAEINSQIAFSLWEGIVVVGVAYELLTATPALSEGVIYERSAQSLFAVGPKK
jgi:hypothetical protein